MYITKENAEVFWNEIEAQTEELERLVEKLEQQVAEKVKESNYAGSFEIQWQCSAIAGRNALIDLKERIATSRESGDVVNRNGDLMIVALIQGLLNRALRESSTSTFHAANLVESMELDYIREIVRRATAYAIKEQTTELEPAL